MSTKSDVFESSNGRIYFDSVHQFETEVDLHSSDLTIEIEDDVAQFSKDDIDGGCCLNFNKDTDIYRFLSSVLLKSDINIESIFSKILSFYVPDGNPEVFKQKIEQYKSELLSL